MINKELKVAIKLHQKLLAIESLDLERFESTGIKLSDEESEKIEETLTGLGYL